MKRIIGLLLLLPALTFSQIRALEITNPKTGKVIKIAEKKRVKLKMTSGEKAKGKITFANDSTMVIKEKEISLKEIAFIQKRPEGLAFLGGVIFIHFGMYIPQILAYPDNFFLIPYVTIIMVVGGELHNIFKKRYRYNQYNFKIISQP